MGKMSNFKRQLPEDAWRPIAAPLQTPTHDEVERAEVECDPPIDRTSMIMPPINVGVELTPDRASGMVSSGPQTAKPEFLSSQGGIEILTQVTPVDIVAEEGNSA